MTKYNYERMYKELTNEIVQLKGTDELGQSVKINSVINLLNIVEDTEREIAAAESKKEIEETQTDIEKETEKNIGFSIRDFANKNRRIKE